MKSKVGHYYNLSNPEKIDLWNSGRFIFDTNVLLKLYFLTDDAREKFYQAVDVLAERLWLPHHIAYEFSTNRFAKIYESKKRYNNEFKNIENLFSGIYSSLNIQNSNEDIDKLHEEIKHWLSNHQESNLPFKDYSEDSVALKLFELFDDKTGEAFSEEELDSIKLDGEERHKDSIPPGYKDYTKIDEKTNTDKKLYSENNHLGDLIIWKQILQYARDHSVDIIFVTEDNKDDWWYEESGEKIGARLELRREFANATGKRFVIYNLGSFLHHFNEYSNQFPNIEKIPDSVLNEVSVKENLRIIENAFLIKSEYTANFLPISTEIFVNELNDALSYFNSFGGFLSSKYFIEKILASKDYDIGLCWEKANELERNGTIEMYIHEDGENYPLSAIRFRK